MATFSSWWKVRGASVALFQARITFGGSVSVRKRQHAVAADGQLFLMAVVTASLTTIVQNWTAALKK